MKVLCADDNATLRGMINAMLATNDIKVDFAANGSEAVDAYQSSEYDAILMDIEMPVMSGLQAAREIRQIEHGFHLQHTPIIFLSGLIDEAAVDVSAEAGGDAHIVKPFTANALLSTLDHIVGERHKAGAPR